MPGWETAFAFFATALFLSIAPGPDNIFVLTQSALYGARAGISTTMGLVCGLCAHTLAVALGVAVIFQASPLAFNILKCFGAGYLCWLAWLSWRDGAAIAAGGVANGAFPGHWAFFRRGIVMNVTNPKVCLFFLAFLPQFCSPSKGSIGLQVVFLGMLFMLATIIVFFTVAALGGKLADWLNKSAKAQIFMRRSASLIFAGLALALVFID